jgi:hypothetical protein
MKIKRHFFGILLGVTLLTSLQARADSDFHPAETWLDAEGNSIEAHGGGILHFGAVYYWYGEDRTPGLHSAVSCYSSTNLLDWKREGVALWQTNLPYVNHRRTFIERPKVIYNAHTKKFVMWMHLEQGRYTFSHAGIAISDTPTGPFTFISAIRPVADTNDFETETNDPTHQNLYGGTFRDMNLFQDDDGHAYAFYSSAGNWTMYVVRLNDDYTGPQLPAVENKTWARLLVRQMREGPAPFKWNGKYFLITSACTGWAPNAANYSMADNILGPWQTFSNPCVGNNSQITFNSQSTYVLPVPGHADDFIFMSDRWNPDDLPDSRYIWLPFTMKAGGQFTISWRDHWNFSDLTAQ